MLQWVASRGVVSADELDHGLARLPPWQALKGIDFAAARLAEAIARAERILVVADYDADGATACAVAVIALIGIVTTAVALVLVPLASLAVWGLGAFPTQSMERTKSR